MANILLVEDDPLQAFLTMSLLGRQFGEVHRATDAAEALCLVEQPEFANKLTLVICGHCSGGITGPAFVAELHARMPHMPVLVLGTSQTRAADYTDEPVAFLPRPFVAAKMLALTRQMLEGKKNAVA